MTPAERVDTYRFVDAAMVIIDIEIVCGFTHEEIACLLSVDVETVRNICRFDLQDGVDVAAVEAIADRASKITAHDRMRLAAFRAKTEQIPGNISKAAATSDA